MTAKKSENVEDIFEETDVASKPAAGRATRSVPPRAGRPASGTPLSASAPARPSRRRTLMLVVAGVVLAVAALAVLGQQLLSNRPGTTDQRANTASVTIANSNSALTVPIVTDQQDDSDADGLTDQEEQSLGTKTDSADSDGDGLYDREEVKVYKSDPLKPDTDGDGIKDGEEVRNGYDPAGSGKLLDLPAEINKLDQ